MQDKFNGVNSFCASYILMKVKRILHGTRGTKRVKETRKNENKAVVM